MASKPGRNDPCPCGSGQKYKRCCLQKDQLAESAALAETAAEAAALRAAAARRYEHGPGQCDFCGEVHDDDDDEEDELTRDSNAVVDLIEEGKLDQAEQAARDLLERYPEVHDGYDRLGMVYEARGEPKQAADCYRKVIEFIRTHPDQYGPELQTVFEDMVTELDPPPAP
jgi:tetratricopeptide (TPR) repeat protein